MKKELLDIIPEIPETIEIWIDENNYPSIYNRKIKELVEMSGMTEEEARAFIIQTPFVLELVYHENYGLFGVESEAVDSTPIYSPYTGQECKEPEC